MCASPRWASEGKSISEMPVLSFWQNYWQFSELLSFQSLQVKKPTRVSVFKRTWSCVWKPSPMDPSIPLMATGWGP